MGRGDIPLVQIKRVCAYCGKEFIATHPSQKYCKGPHYRKCEVCGKEFEFKIPANIADARKTCSRECANALRFKNGNPGANFEVRRKMAETYKARTGYDHPMHNPEVINKVRKTNLDNHDGVYAQTTQEYRDRTIQTNVEKYGVEWHTQNAEVRSKIEKSVQDKYGVENVSQLPEVKAKIRDTYEQHTGYDHYTHNPEAMQSVQQTNLDKYGVPWAVSAPQVREKSQNTMLDRYGVLNAMQNPEILDKSQRTTEQRYGNRVYLLTEEGKKKSRDRMVERYGKPRFSMTSIWKEGMMIHPERVEDWMYFLEHPNEVLDRYSSKPNLYRLSQDLGVSVEAVSAWINRLGLQTRVKYTLSVMEEQVVDMLLNINPNLSIRRHVRNIVPNMELDILLPEFNLGIECDPTYSHNSSIGTAWDDAKLPNYHYKKSKAFMENGVFVFHIFGYEWTHRRPIIESMLRNYVHCTSTRIYARNCSIVSVSSRDGREFLDLNHRQGYTSSTVSLGLQHKGSLVSIACFSKPRALMGATRSVDNSTWELTRFCNILNTNVVGGASRLLKAFIRQYNPDTIRSFSDKAHTRGNLYEQLDFKRVREVHPSYVWVSVKDDSAIHRSSAAKSNLPKLLRDPNIDLSNTEKQIMEEHGYVQVYDSGLVLWEWNR